MAKDKSVTINRILRQEFEDGAQKCPRSVPYAIDLGFYHSISTVLLPGYTNKTTFVEFKPGKLQALINSIYAEEGERLAVLLKKSDVKKNKRIKELKKVVAAKDDAIKQGADLIDDLTLSMSLATARLKRTEKELQESQKTTHEIERKLETARFNAIGHQEEVSELGREVEWLKGALQDLATRHEALQATNTQLMELVDNPNQEAKEEVARMRSSTDLWSKPVIIFNPKLLPGSYQSRS
ncbi:hypothetical protein PS903_02493 [Pseudomonas fluorescens]|nr:hypothetical protein PS903_02493 [Pseudomonas fluorescens]